MGAEELLGVGVRVLITGASGFVGNHVFRHVLNAGYTPVGTSKRENVHGTKTADLSEKNSVKHLFDTTRPDVVIHLAWQGLPDYSPEVCEFNRLMSTNVINEAFRRDNVKFFGVGSCWEYAARQGVLDEDSPTSKGSPFAAAKLRLLEYGREKALETGNAFIWLRPFFIYGPGQRSASVIPFLAQSLSSGMLPDLKTPDARNDFIHVDDVASAICALIQADTAGGAYNIGAAEATSMRRITRLVCSALNKSIPEEYEKDREPEGDNFCACIDKLTTETGWFPCVKLEQGVSETVAALSKEIV